MKTLFASIIAALIANNTAFAGAGTLFKGGIGLPDWQFDSATTVKNSSATKASLKAPRAKSHGTDRRVTER